MLKSCIKINSPYETFIFFSNPWSSSLNVLGCFLSSLLGFIILRGSLFPSRGLARLFSVLSSSDGLLSLSLADFWLLISLGHDVLKGSPYNCSLELCCALV